jgi:hypothetical protein
MPNCKKVLLLTSTFFIHLIAISQNTAIKAASKDDGFMRSEGKIYVVMAVAITILAGLILYLARLDRKISRFEKGENFQ